jgi:hypothetical protein
LRFPESAVPLDPGGGVFHGPGRQAATVHAAVDFSPEQAGGFENAEVFGDSGKGHRKRSGQSLDGGFALSESREDGAASRVGERAESGVQLRRGIVNHTVYYSTGGRACQEVFSQLGRWGRCGCVVFTSTPGNEKALTVR